MPLKISFLFFHHYYHGREIHIHIPIDQIFSLFPCYYCNFVENYLFDEGKVECTQGPLFCKKLIQHYTHPDEYPLPRCLRWNPVEDYIWFLKCQSVVQPKFLHLKQIEIPFLINKEKKLIKWERYSLLR